MYNYLYFQSRLLRVTLSTNNSSDSYVRTYVPCMLKKLSSVKDKLLLKDNDICEAD